VGDAGGAGGFSLIAPVGCVVGDGACVVVGPVGRDVLVWPQAVIATAPLNASDGDIQPSVGRGRPFSDRAMALSCV